VLNVATGYFRDADARGAVRWFDGGGSLQLSDSTGAKELVDRTREVDGLHEAALQAQGGTSPGQAELASAVDFALEALCAQKKISRSDDWRYSAGEGAGGRRQQGRERERTRQHEAFDDDEQQLNVPGKKKYYN
jgi:magnesium chelatase subunit I